MVSANGNPEEMPEVWYEKLAGRKREGAESMNPDKYEGGLELEIQAARHSLENEIQNARQVLAEMDANLINGDFPGFSCLNDRLNQEYFRLRALLQALALCRESKPPANQEKTQ
jgi:hypothetical protein